MNIDAILAELGIDNYTIVPRGVDVEGDVVVSPEYISIPVQFNYVSGDFSCYNTKITSLDGAPREVGGSFYCYGTKIKGKPDASELGGFFINLS